MTTAPQELQLELMKHASFNALDGARIATDLRAHHELWTAALLFQPDVSTALFMLTQGNWDADTLYIVASGKDDDALVELARTWGPEQVEWAPDAGEGVLVAWWD